MYTDYVDENQEDDNQVEDYYIDDNNNNNNNNNNKDKIKKIALIAIIFCLALIIIVLLAKGCSNSSKKEENNNSNTATTTIIINHKNLALKVGENVELNADVLNAKNSNPIVLWMSDDTAIASVTDDGIVTGNSEGTTVIRAIYNEIEEECSVVVTASEVHVKSIKIVQGDISLKKGEGTLLQIETSPEDAKTGNLTYSTDNSAVATVSNIGYVNAINVGTTTITVKTDSGLSSSITVRVTDNGSTIIQPTSVVIYGLENTLVAGGTSKILFDVLPSNATNKTVSWSSSDPSIASVDANNVITGHKAGTCTITVSTSNNLTARYDVTVGSSTVAVTGITVTNGNTYDMQVGYVKRIQYSVEPTNATNKKVMFSSNNPSVAAVDSNGLVAANQAGTALITLTTEDGRKTAIIVVNVTSNSTSGSSGGTQTGDNSGGSSSGSTGNTDSGSSSSGSSSSSSGSTSSCGAYSMITVANNQKSDGAVVSSISFANASPYTNSSKGASIEVTQIADCVESMMYKVYYGESATAVNNTSFFVSGTIKNIGRVINFNKGDGYYKVVVTAIDKESGINLTKTYYAIVKFNQSIPTLELTQINFSSITSTAKIGFLVKSDAGIASIKYCSTIAQTGCNPTTSRSVGGGKSYSTTITFSNIKSGYTVCGIAYDINGLQSKRECILVK